MAMRVIKLAKRDVRKVSKTPSVPWGHPWGGGWLRHAVTDTGEQVWVMYPFGRWGYFERNGQWYKFKLKQDWR